MPFKNKLFDNELNSVSYLEDVLLVKGWRRYKWQDLELVKSTDTIQHSASLNITGTTFMNDKPLKRPVQLFIAKSIAPKTPGLELLDTDSIGRFELTRDKLTGEANKTLQITVNNPNKEYYSIKVNDAYKDMNRKLAASLFFSSYDINSFAQSSQQIVLSKEDGGKRLLDVKVTAKNDLSIFATAGRGRGPNVCGDYVCPFNILNCINHPYDGWEPVIGETYMFRNAGSIKPMEKIVYSGCLALLDEGKKEYQIKMDGIYTKKEFYVAELSKMDMSDPQYLSTIYWNHSMLTNDNGEAEFTFFTSDIPGRFRVVIQGITSKDVVYGEKVFDIRKQ